VSTHPTAREHELETQLHDAEAAYARVCEAWHTAERQASSLAVQVRDLDAALGDLRARWVPRTVLDALAPTCRDEGRR
jgi:hypothetical protein